MNYLFDAANDFYRFLYEFPDRLSKISTESLSATLQKSTAAQLYWNGILKYFHDFVDSYWLALGFFQTAEQQKLIRFPVWENYNDYMGILELNLRLAADAAISSEKSVSDYHLKQLVESFSAFMNTVFDLNGNHVDDLTAQQMELMNRVVHTLPDYIRDIRAEFGFHFESGGYIKTAETDRFLLYQILPIDRETPVREDGKPIVVIPPYVLGANVLAFLPYDNKSYVHNYANLGIPIYIRINKDIATTPAYQLMTPEDDALDTRYFCEILAKKHGKPVTLNGYCQGGFNSICNILSGELDGVVDALITCVSPMDGTRSKGLGTFLSVMLPQRFNDLSYGTKTLPNGNRVASGKLMGWVYKLKAIENEFPLVSFYRDMNMLSSKDGKEVKINKTMAAIQHWLRYDRADLPLGITDVSFKSYNIPVTKDGTLPITLFGRSLNFHRIKEKGIRWLICYGENDDLVEKETALAPLDYIDVEVTPFPKGHVAIATSWSNPASEYALHTRFGEGGKYRGPVRFQLDLEEELKKKGNS
ncbi:MAG: metal transporter [Deltaproteobacteria bacterium]|nr:metal transporter [Deltaproteobacteria bacterium]